jgi:tetratricopeptide (TPR) repeat protein
MLMPTGFDARAAADRNIADARDLVRTHPHDLGPLIRLGGALLNLNDGQAIIDVLQPAKPGRDNTDMRATDEDRARWWLLMADAQTDLGHHDQAVAALRASMAPGEANENDPSEPINIASVHLRFGHADQALATLATLNQRPPRWNPANEDRLRQLRACALAQTDHSDQSQPDLTYLRERGNGAAGFLTAALLCTHHDDDVAAIMIRDLENPIKSPNLRLRLSTYAPPPVNFPPDVFRQGLLRVAARPDVRAAMARTGGIGTFDIPPP